MGVVMMTVLDKLKEIMNSKSTKIAHAEPVKTNTGFEEKQKKVTLLTPREHELYLLILEGFTLKESAKGLSIKYSTANTHMTAIYKKLGVNTRAELIINYRGINSSEI